ncbi:hypothetical protein [Helicobacter cetorum]|uniref:Lipoprotein n=1 Tax=Helicobacter cetorum (strain ATCC BAA-429 / MIT 00-7128) TaxID=182217 RepID=I0EL67_HELC0|nr:hypothetical protein [Helicobacter cetorum]AFI03686.1 lipoprotein [Helicobacter cetorum MIT 00-7128]
MKTNLWIKGLGALSLALVMAGCGSSPIDVSVEKKHETNIFTSELTKQTYLNISSKADDVVIQNVELNRGKCKNESFGLKLGGWYSYTHLENYERERADIIKRIEGYDDPDFYPTNIKRAQEEVQKEIKKVEEQKREVSSFKTYEELKQKKGVLASKTKEEYTKDNELFSLSYFNSFLSELHISYINSFNDYCGDDYKGLIMKECPKYKNNKYYHSKYVANIIGVNTYNKLTDKKFLSKISKKEFEQIVFPLMPKFHEVFFKRYKEVFPKIVKTDKIDEAKRHLNQLLKEKQQDQEKLAQVEQKIKEMKEQGNTMEVPLKFGEVFRIPTCNNLKEAKIKTNKGTYTFSF